MRRDIQRRRLLAGAVVIDGTKVLLVRRGQEPLKGQWSLPGGALELGETLQQGVVSEVLEETGLILVRPELSKSWTELRRRRHRGGFATTMCWSILCVV